MRVTKRDSGYAWVILGACFVNNFLSVSLYFGPAVYMIEWQKSFNASKAQVTMVSSIACSLSCFTALALGPLLTRFGAQPVMIIGIILISLGNLCSLLAANIWWLLLSFGICVGIGHGMVQYPPYVIIHYYFDKKRAFATGFSMVGRSIGAFLTTPLIQFLCDQYGWRGTLLLHTGMLLHLIAISILYVKPNLPELNQSKANTAKAKLKSRLDDYFRLLYDFVFIRFLVADILYAFSVDYMFQFTPLRAVSIGISQVQASLLPSIAAIVITSVRIPISIIANLRCINRILLMTIGFLGAGIMVVVCTLANTFPTYAALMVLYAIVYSFGSTVASTTMVDLIGVKNVAQGEAFMSGGAGLVAIFSLPLAGVIVDLTNDLNIANYLYGSFNIMAGLLILSIFITQKRTPQTRCGESTQNHEELTVINNNLQPKEQEAIIEESIHALDNFQKVSNT